MRDLVYSRVVYIRIFRAAVSRMSLDLAFDMNREQFCPSVCPSVTLAEYTSCMH